MPTPRYLTTGCLTVRPARPLAGAAAIGLGRRPGFSLLGLLLLLSALALTAAVAVWFMRPILFGDSDDTSYLTDRVKVGVFTHDVVERGDMESSSNVEVRCEVTSRASSGTSIIEIVPEGYLPRARDPVQFTVARRYSDMKKAADCRR